MADQMFFPYTTTILTGVVQGKEFKTPAYLRDTFFSNVMTSTAKYVAFDKLPDGDRALAPFVNRRVGGKRIELEGYKTEMYEPPVVGNHFTVTPEDAFMRAPGHTEYDLAGPGAFLDHQISSGLRRIENMISRREEWMCAQALLKGEITIKGDGVNEETIQYWSHLTEAEQPKTTLATPWTDASVTANDIINDLSSVVDSVVMRSGLMPRKIICGQAVYKALREKLSESKLLDMRYVEMGNIAPTQLPNNVRRLGYLAEPGIEIYSYVDRYNDNGNILPMIPDDVCLFVSPEVNTIMAYGAIANGWNTNGAPNLERGTRFSFERPHDSLEQGRAIYLQSSPLPIIQSTDGFHVLKAV